MTGEALYRKHCQAINKTQRGWNNGTYNALMVDAPKAWPFIGDRNRRQWNELARLITPRRKKP